MEIKYKILKWVIVAMAALLLAGVVYSVLHELSHSKETAALRNELASKDKTIEVAKGVYERLTIESSNLSKLLSSKDSEIVELKKVIKKNDESILVATTVTATWKKAYEALVKGVQTDVPGSQPTDPARKKVSFDKDFGYIGVSGYTLTDPAEAWVSVKQNRPLRLTVTVTQDDSGKWKTRVASSEENIAYDITLASVNPKMLAERWYERLSLAVEFGGGPDAAIAGLGADVRLGKFRIGPMVWALAGIGKFSMYYGVTFGWSPFKR